jgi:uncharacterized protein YbjT (DUF2867 family)
MSKTLVVGATGQLGVAATKKLRASGKDVRALVRSAATVARFQELGAETAIGDLTQPDTLRAACAGISTIVATANAAIPSRATDTFEAVERHGYRNLIRAAVDAGVSRFIYTSVLRSKYEQSIEFFRWKRETEERLAESGMDHVIFRADAFMDVAFVMLGSTVPLRGAEAATVLRPFKFAQSHLERVKDSIEKKRTALIPGDGSVRHCFICVDDVAGFLASAACGGPSGVFDVGGPDPVTFLDIVRLYEKILGCKLRVKQTPAWVFRVAAPLIRPFSPAGANLMQLNIIAATEETVLDSMRAASAFHIQLTSAESFLRGKIAAAAAA